MLLRLSVEAQHPPLMSRLVAVVVTLWLLRILPEIRLPEVQWPLLRPMLEALLLLPSPSIVLRMPEVVLLRRRRQDPEKHRRN
jgi:hypothetical protein